jgi:hypothetical protein
MDSSDRMSTSRDLTKPQNILWMGEEFTGISANSADASATTVQSIPDSPDISLNDVSFTSMTVHMERARRRQECYGFRRFLEPAVARWIVRRLECLHQVGRSYRIPSMAGQESTGISETRRTPVQPPYRIFNSPDISLNDVSYFHDCAHGDGLRRRQECYGFDVSWIP